jgi:hypothetical protein
MVGQQGGWIALYSDNTVTHSKTVQVSNRKTRAEIALSHVSEYALAVVSQVVSDSGVEEPNKPIVLRNGVTSVTFTVLVSDSGCTCRWILHFWS